MTNLLVLFIWMRVRGYKGHKKTPYKFQHLGIMKVVKHIDLYLSYTGKCIIDLN